MAYETVIELAAGFCAVVVATLTGLLLWSVAKLRDARSACVRSERARTEASAMLDTVPLAAFRWPAGRDPDGYSVQTVAYPKFLTELARGGATLLEAARGVLQRDGTPFSLTVGLCSGGAFTIEGRRAVTGETVLWLLDSGAAALARQADDEAASLRQLIDAVPVPIWRRGRDRALVDCNRAYASAVDATRELAVIESRELAPVQGSREQEIACGGIAAEEGWRGVRRHVVVGGARRLLDIVELPCSDGGALGFALDRTDVEIAETELRRQVGAHAEVLESIGAAVAIYDADQRLKFFNAAFAELWGLEPEWLAGEPSFGDVLERLRERRRIPEHADFRAFKRERL